jgi:hypothetical protein
MARRDKPSPEQKHPRGRREFVLLSDRKPSREESGKR